MQPNAELVIKDLLNQVASLSRDKAIFYALATEKQAENEQLKKEIEELKKGSTEAE